MRIIGGPRHYDATDVNQIWWAYDVERSFGEPDEEPKYWPRGLTVVVWVDADTGAILLAADRSHSPYIDILERDSTQINAIRTRVRLGRLSGIVDTVLNPRGFGLYTDHGFFKGLVSIGGLESEDTAIEIFDTTGNRRGLVTNVGSGWFGGYESFRWDENGTVFIKNLELDNLILVGGGVDATGGIIVSIGLQEGLSIQSNTRQLNEIIRWDNTQFTVVNDKLEETLVFISNGEIRIGSQTSGFWSDGTRGIMTIADGVHVKEEHARNILMQRDATSKSHFRVEGEALMNHLTVHDFGPGPGLLLYGDATIKGDIRLDGQGIGYFEGRGTGDFSDVDIWRDLIIHDDATVKDDIYVEDHGTIYNGLTTDFTSQGIVFKVVKGLIVEARHHSG